MKSRRFLFLGFIVLVYAYLLSPVAVVILTSFNPTRLTVFPPTGFSLMWYKEFFQDPTFMNAFFNVSLKVGVIVSIVSTLMAIMASIAIVRFRFKGVAIIETFFLSPMMIPHILIGISLLLFLTKFMVGDMIRLIIGHVIICTPIAIRAIYASLSGLDPSLEEAARTLGANRLQTFYLVTLRLTFSGVLAAIIFSFIISFTDVNVSLFLTGPGITTLPIEIFTYLQWESTPVVAAITTVQVAMIIGFSFLLERLVGLSTVMKY